MEGAVYILICFGDKTYSISSKLRIVKDCSVYLGGTHFYVCFLWDHRNITFHHLSHTDLTVHHCVKYTIEKEYIFVYGIITNPGNILQLCKDMLTLSHSCNWCSLNEYWLAMLPDRMPAYEIIWAPWIYKFLPLGFDDTQKTISETWRARHRTLGQGSN